MPLQFTQRQPEEVPSASSTGKVNQDLLVIKNEMASLAPGMVLEIQTDAISTVRSTKVLVTKASKELGTQWRHWHAGSTVYASPIDVSKRRGRPRNAV